MGQLDSAAEAARQEFQTDPLPKRRKIDAASATAYMANGLAEDAIPSTMSGMAQRLRYPELSPGGVAALRSLEHYLNAEIALPAVLLELVRLRCSRVNGCEYCIALHSAELRKHHEPESRIDAVGDWERSDAFTRKERAALAWADAITNIQEKHASEAQYVAINEFFHDRDLSDLTLAIASINAWNRLAIAFRPVWRGDRTKSPDAIAHAAMQHAGDESSSDRSTKDHLNPAIKSDGGKAAQD